MYSSKLGCGSNESSDMVESATLRFRPSKGEAIVGDFWCGVSAVNVSCLGFLVFETYLSVFFELDFILERPLGDKLRFGERLLGE